MNFFQNMVYIFFTKVPSMNEIILGMIVSSRLNSWHRRDSKDHKKLSALSSRRELVL